MKSWAIERKVWKISNDGELEAEYPKPDGSKFSMKRRDKTFMTFQLGTEALRLYKQDSPNGGDIAWLKINHSKLGSLQAFVSVGHFYNSFVSFNPRTSTPAEGGLRRRCVISKRASCPPIVLGTTSFEMSFVQ